MKLIRRHNLYITLTAIICFCLLNWQHQCGSFSFLLDCLFFAVLGMVSISDLSTMTIPDFCHVAILALGVLSLLLPGPSLPSRLLGLLVISLPLLLIAFFSGGFGGGDIKLCAAAGFYLGPWLVTLGALTGTLLAACYAVFLLLSGKAGKKDSICFGPFLALGFIISVLYGPAILELFPYLPALPAY